MDNEDAVDEAPDVGLPSPSPCPGSPPPTPRPSLTSASSVAPSRTPSPFPSCSSGGTSKKRKQNDEVDNVMALALNKLSSLPSPNNREPFLDISRFIDTELKNMSEMQQKLAKKIICDVLHMGNMGDLTRDHKVLRVVVSDNFIA